MHSARLELFSAVLLSSAVALQLEAEYQQAKESLAKYEKELATEKAKNKTLNASKAELAATAEKGKKLLAKGKAEVGSRSKTLAGTRRRILAMAHADARAR